MAINEDPHADRAFMRLALEQVHLRLHPHSRMNRLDSLIALYIGGLRKSLAICSTRPLNLI